MYTHVREPCSFQPPPCRFTPEAGMPAPANDPTNLVNDSEQRKARNKWRWACAAWWLEAAVRILKPVANDGQRDNSNCARG